MKILFMGFLLFTVIFFLFISNSSGLQLCTDSRAPITLKTALSFCSYNGSSCCSAADDSSIKKQFESMNVSDPACASLVQSILCAKCNPFSADLFTIGSKIRTVPILCNSTLSSASSQTKDSTSDFCAQVWVTCKGTSITNSPFAPSLQGSARAPSSSASKLTDLWQSQSDFCEAFGGSSDNESLCFTGQSVLFNATPNSPAPKGVCLERIGDGEYLNMAAHPDGSNRVFLANKAGKIWLATVPKQGSGGTLEFDESSPFLDITDEVLVDSKFGVMGLAFHPNFASNGRFFVSFTCDKVQSASCNGRCSCNSDVGCDPSKLGTDDGVQPCQYQSLIAEFSTNSSSSNPSMATSASPIEVRRIFTMGLPFTSNHGGQILFGPADGYLYYMMGDGGKKGDPYNFSQNKKSLLGKIMRFDVNNIPSQRDIIDLGLWGNYSIPKDNPSADDSELQAEIWALGLRNPWRCSFDSERPSYFMCADVGELWYLVITGIREPAEVVEGVPPILHWGSNARSMKRSQVKKKMVATQPKAMGEDLKRYIAERREHKPMLLKAEEEEKDKQPDDVPMLLKAEEEEKDKQPDAVPMLLKAEEEEKDKQPDMVSEGIVKTIEQDDVPMLLKAEEKEEDKTLEQDDVPQSSLPEESRSVTLDEYEEVDLISKGGNYGWRIFEGPEVYHPHSTPGGNTSAASVNAIFPVMGYTHSTLNNSVGSASIIGGYVYRSMTDPCMFGRYLYADLYAGAMWAGTETPENSGNYSSTMIPFSCSKNSPIPCETTTGSSLPALGYIYSFAEDNNKDVFLLASKGVYRVVPPSRCNYSCPKERITNNTTEAPGPSSSASYLVNLQPMMSLLFVLVFFFQGSFVF